MYKVGTAVIAPIRSHCLSEHVGSKVITFPLNTRFQPCISYYDFPKTAKGVSKNTKKERNIAILLLYRVLDLLLVLSLTSIEG